MVKLIQYTVDSSWSHVQEINSGKFNTEYNGFYEEWKAIDYNPLTKKAIIEVKQTYKGTRITDNQQTPNSHE